MYVYSRIQQQIVFEVVSAMNRSITARPFDQNGGVVQWKRLFRFRFISYEKITLYCHIPYVLACIHKSVMWQRVKSYRQHLQTVQTRSSMHATSLSEHKRRSTQLGISFVVCNPRVGKPSYLAISQCLV